MTASNFRAICHINLGKPSRASSKSSAIQKQINIHLLSTAIQRHPNIHQLPRAAGASHEKVARELSLQIMAKLTATLRYRHHVVQLVRSIHPLGGGGGGGVTSNGLKVVIVVALDAMK